MPASDNCHCTVGTSQDELLVCEESLHQVVAWSISVWSAHFIQVIDTGATGAEKAGISPISPVDSAGHPRQSCVSPVCMYVCTYILMLVVVGSMLWCFDNLSFADGAPLALSSSPFLAVRTRQCAFEEFSPP